MPEKMTVKQYSFTGAQIEAIKARAHDGECSEAAVARLAVDKLLGLSSESWEGRKSKREAGVLTPPAAHLAQKGIESL